MAPEISGVVCDIIFPMKGNPNYNSGELNLIKGLQISEVKKKLGYIRQKEVIERKHIHLVRDEK